MNKYPYIEIITKHRSLQRGYFTIEVINTYIKPYLIYPNTRIVRIQRNEPRQQLPNTELTTLQTMDYHDTTQAGHAPITLTDALTPALRTLIHKKTKKRKFMTC